MNQDNINQKEHVLSNVRVITKLIDKFNKDFIKIADIGSYPGTLAFILRKIYASDQLKISIYDHPNIINNNLSYLNFCKNNQISQHSLDLKNFENLNDSYDILIMSEVLEHLPTNPYHVLKKISSRLSEEGFLFLTVPNNAKLKNRIKLFFGQSVFENINSYFVDEDHPNNLYGYHWREYTVIELSSILQKCDLKINLIKTIGYDNKFTNMLINYLNKIFRSCMGQKIISISSKINKIKL